jgi:hypothetical protein
MNAPGGCGREVPVAVGGLIVSLHFRELDAGFLKWRNATLLVFHNEKNERLNLWQDLYL